MNSFREIPIEKKENFFNQESHTRHFKIQLFELESQLKTLANVHFF